MIDIQTRARAAKQREMNVLASIGLVGGKTWAEIEASATREVVDAETGRTRRLMTPEQFAKTVKALASEGRIVRSGSGMTATIARTTRRFS